MWQEMTTAPKDGTNILLGFKGHSAEGYWHDGSENYWGRAGWYFIDDDLLTARPCQPWCWMPMPVPPGEMTR